LSASLGDRYQRKGDRKDLEKAIEYDREILKLAGTNHEDRPAYLRNLASSFHDLYIDKKKSVDKKEPHDLRDLQNAIATIKKAMRGMDPKNPHYPECLQNMAIYFADRYEERKKLDDAKRALRYYRNSFARITINFNPTQSFKAALRWVSLAQDHDNPENCRKAYETVFCLLPQILWIGNSLNDHKTVCRRINIADVTSKAVSAYIENGDLKDAIELVDQGLATAIQQSMQLKNRPGQCSLRTEDEQEMKSLSLQICRRRAPLGDRRKALMQRDALIKRIRGQEDLDRFLLPRDYEQLSEAAKNGPVVILNSDETRCDALILLGAREDPLLLELTNICEDLKNIQNKGQTPKSSVPSATRFPCTQERIPSNELPALLELLKQHIVDPIHTELKEVVGVSAWSYSCVI
jgi:tetratricopeptide (TPR) repeat protein